MTNNVLFFAYNRPLHLELTLTQALKFNKDPSRQFIVIVDGPKNHYDFIKINEIRILLDRLPNVIPIYRKNNVGLERNISSGVSDFFINFDTLIILEDDILIDEPFFEFFDQNLSRFSDSNKVASIQGYSPYLGKLELDHYFLRGADCWGWGTWKRNWNLYQSSGRVLIKELRRNKLLRDFDLNGSFPYSNMLRGEILKLVESWAIKWHASMFINNKLSLYPYPSLIQNIGFDGSGTNSPLLDLPQSNFVKVQNVPKVSSNNVEESQALVNLLEKYYKSKNQLSNVKKFLYTLKLDFKIALNK